ncbi:MAG: hypothetical protein B6242_09055 [Anaerolineaceae bacterium 4572_78]|nr:MAG: hypothetical protein B6242_09055 [Anaerolineaceae bacterium 4572_78]
MNTVTSGKVRRELYDSPPEDFDYMPSQDAAIAFDQARGTESSGTSLYIQLGIMNALPRWKFGQTDIYRREDIEAMCQWLKLQKKAVESGVWSRLGRVAPTQEMFEKREHYNSIPADELGKVLTDQKDEPIMINESYQHPPEDLKYMASNTVFQIFHEAHGRIISRQNWHSTGVLESLSRWPMNREMKKRPNLIYSKEEVNGMAEWLYIRRGLITLGVLNRMYPKCPTWDEYNKRQQYLKDSPDYEGKVVVSPDGEIWHPDMPKKKK